LSTVGTRSSVVCRRIIESLTRSPPLWLPRNFFTDDMLNIIAEARSGILVEQVNHPPVLQRQISGVARFNQPTCLGEVIAGRFLLYGTKSLTLAC
jgi:hypothetical protein